MLTAATIAFGFVFIHPFEGGNGRLHRYLIYHILIETGFIPKGIVFPISSVIFKKIIDYVKALESYSNPRFSFIEWRPIEKGNLEVTNNTINLYRFFDATIQEEFLYDCIEETINKTLPEEVKYLQNHDEIKIFINSYIDIPNHTLERMRSNKSGSLNYSSLIFQGNNSCIFCEL